MNVQKGRLSGIDYGYDINSIVVPITVRIIGDEEITRHLEPLQLRVSTYLTLLPWVVL